MLAFYKRSLSAALQSFSYLALSLHVYAQSGGALY